MKLRERNGMLTIKRSYFLRLTIRDLGTFRQAFQVQK